MEKSKPTTSVVCDAGPIIHLSELDSLHILNDFETVLLPDSVYNEILILSTFPVPPSCLAEA